MYDKWVSHPVSGDFVAAFSNDADTVTVQDYLASTAWAQSRMKLGRTISPAKTITASDTPDVLLKASVGLVHDTAGTIRLSASDLMPSVVGEGTYLSGMVDWEWSTGSMGPRQTRFRQRSMGLGPRTRLTRGRT